MISTNIKTQYEYLFLIGSALVIIIIFLPMLDDIHITEYQFYTVTKLSHVYENPVYISFNWKTEDEVITGKPVHVSAEVFLPHRNFDSLKKIEIKFEGLGYYDKYSNSYFERIEENDTVILEPIDQNGMFRSPSIEIRYSGEGMKSVEYCDYNISPSCTKIHDVIEVQSRATAFEASIAKLIMIGTAAIYILTVVLIFYTVRLIRISSRS